MGNCVGSGSKSEDKPVSKEQHALTIHHQNEQKLILKLLAEVNTLSADDGPLRWQPLFHSLIPVSLHCIQEEPVYLYRVSGSGVTGTSFSADIRVPGTKIRKTSDCFIQWRDDEKAGAWGLNFMSEADAIQFLNGCSPPTLTPMAERLRHTFSTLSLSLPIPEPPCKSESADNTKSHHKPTMRTLTPEQSESESKSPDDSIEYDDSFALSYSSHEDEDDRDLPNLYQPSSPFHGNQGFVLPDIMEENEDDMLSEDRSLRRLSSMETSETLESRNFDHGFKEADVDIDIMNNVAETNFTDDIVDEASNNQNLPGQGDEETIPGPFEAPVLPSSPPPGPLLSPRLSMLLAEGKAYGDLDTSRFSFADDVPPPPLPSSLPPGKLISPRSSKYLDRSSYIIEEHVPTLELMSKIGALKEERESEEPTESEKEVPNQETEHKEASEDVDGVDPMLAVVPPPVASDEDEGDLKPKRRQSVYFDPPPQFQTGSDSGFTDMIPLHSDHSTSGGNIVQDAVEPPRGILSEGRDGRGHHRRGSSTTTTDERLTEYSESVDMKTNVSSTSRHSLTEDEETNVNVNKNETRVEKDETDGHIPAARSVPDHESLRPAIRKTGWVDLKPMLTSKNRKVAMSAKRKWKKYWATLKGSLLLLYQCDEESALSENAHVDLRIDLELCLAHAVHDHVKRDHIFCLSTSNGKSYYIQTTNQSEVEDWITVIHCAAATALTSQPHKGEAVKYLKNQVVELNKMIEKETQLRNMTELNMKSPLTEHTGRSMAADQVVACSENIEKYNVELYRIRCYIASMEGTELPNPQSLLGSISKPTKLSLGRIVGTFSVSSIHAMVSARHSVGPSASSGSLSLGFKMVIPGKSGRRGSKEKVVTLPRSPDRPRKLRNLEISHPIPKLPAAQSKTSNQKNTSKKRLEISYPYPKVSLSSSATSLETSPREAGVISPVSGFSHVFSIHESSESDFPLGDVPGSGVPLWALNEVTVHLPGGMTTHLTLRNDMTVRDVLTAICEKHQLNEEDHFMKVIVRTKEEEFIAVVPTDDILFVDLTYISVEICQKSVRTVDLSKPDSESSSSTNDFGLTLTPHWSADKSELKVVVVAEVSEGSVAEAQGIAIGDEIILVNDASVTELGWDRVEHLVNTGSSLSLTLRSKAQSSSSYASSQQILEGLICPAPPSRHRELSGDALQNLIVPRPNNDDENSSVGNASLPEVSQNQIDLLLKDSKELSKLIQRWERRGSLDESGGSTPWTKEDKMRKSATDLVETEAEYVTLLRKLVDRYLKPLKSESFISQDDVNLLTGNIIQIVELQQAFLKCLQDSLTLENTNAPNGESPLKHVALGIAGTFLSHVEHFREYSTFCASHQKLKSIMSSVENEQLREFLDVRNPNLESSLSLEQLLIKPIVRISRYPLFLDAIKKYTEQESEERAQLKDAIESMERVAKYINDTQRLCETYYKIFEEMNESNHSEVGVNVHISQLKYHGEVLWLNPVDEQLARGWKKGQGPSTLCFVFKSAIILLCLDKKNKRKENKGPRELSVTADDVRYKLLLPVVYCGVQDLPDSDGVTNMWQVQCRRKHEHIFKSYLFRSQNLEQKSTMVHLIQQSILEQQRLYGGSPMLLTRSRSSSTPPLYSEGSGRLSPSSLVSFTHSPYRSRLRVTSPTPSQLSLPALSITSDTD